MAAALPAQLTSPFVIQSIKHDLTPWLAGFRRGHVSSAAFAGLYFIYFHMALAGSRFASRRYKADPRPDAQAWRLALSRCQAEDLDTQLSTYFEHYQFLGVIPSVTRALTGWLQAGWPVVLCENVPSARDVLAMQASGNRPVSIILDWDSLLCPVLNKANAFEFLVHDLEHAYKFFHDPVLRQSQQNLFRALTRAVKDEVFARYCCDAEFAKAFDYLISDMNTHVVHSLQYLRANLVGCLLRRDGRLLQDALSTAALAELEEVMVSLGRYGEVGEEALAALAGLARGKTSDEQARVIAAQFAGLRS